MLPGCLNFISPHPGSHPEEGWCLTGMLPSPHRAQDAQPGASSAKRPELVSSQGVIPSYRTAQSFLGPTVASSSCIPSATGWFMSPSCWVAFPPMQGLPGPQAIRLLPTLGLCAGTLQNLLSSVSWCGLRFPGLCVAAFSRSGQRVFPRGHTQDQC